MSTSTLQYSSIRNITPKGLNFEHSIYRGICPAASILGLPTLKNVRDAMEKSSQLRKRLRESITSAPGDFVYKSFGVTILARQLVIDPLKNVAVIEDADIISGAQTQALCQWWSDSYDGAGAMPFLQFEIVALSGQDDLEKEISVARNDTHRVNASTIYGYQGVFDDLIRDVNEKFCLRQTDGGEDPQKLLQVVELLDDAWDKPWTTYCTTAGPLDRYKKIRETDPAWTAKKHALAPEAWSLYKHFRTHAAFERCGLHAKARGVIRDKSKKFLHAADAIVFPIIYAHRERLKNGKVRLLPPKLEEKLVGAATTFFTNNARSDISTMGRKRGSYDDLRGRLEWLGPIE